LGVVSSKKITKLGIVVDNIEEATKKYAELFGVEVPEIKIYTQEEDPTGKTYTWFRGNPIHYYCKIAVIPLEPIVFELLEVPANEPSPWNEFKEKHGQGLHFISFNVNGFEEHIEIMENLGMPLNYKHEKGNMRYGYFDSISKLAVTLEFKERDSN
jgi:methylmalonyl-CoA/ethylmalonyl-CoA epimerase